MTHIGGLRSAEEIRQAQRMVITEVTTESLTAPEETWGIQVDQPLIDEFLLDNTDVDLIERPSLPERCQIEAPISARKNPAEFRLCNCRFGQCAKGNIL